VGKLIILTLDTDDLKFNYKDSGWYNPQYTLTVIDNKVYQQYIPLHDNKRYSRLYNVNQGDTGHLNITDMWVGDGGGSYDILDHHQDILEER
jgi:hypothetical protein